MSAKLTCRRVCPYGACIDICEDYGKTIPPGLRASNPKAYMKLYRERNAEYFREKALAWYYKNKKKKVAA